MMTGCLRIALESVCTDLDHVTWCGVGDALFAGKFGFTPEEVHNLLCEMDLAGKEDKIRTFYDGYCFGTEQEIYCPWDVMKYLSDLQNNPDLTPQAYWLNSSSNDVVHEFVRRTDLNIDDEITTLIHGGSIRTTINSSLAYDDLDSSVEKIWTLLYMTGYLTREPGSLADKNGAIALRIPNKEIMKLFASCMNSRLSAANTTRR